MLLSSRNQVRNFFIFAVAFFKLWVLFLTILYDKVETENSHEAGFVQEMSHLLAVIRTR